MRRTTSSSGGASSCSSQDISASEIRNEIETGKKTLQVNLTVQDIEKIVADIKEKRKRRRNSSDSFKDFVTSSSEDETVLHSISENEPEIEVRFITFMS